MSDVREAEFLLRLQGDDKVSAILDAMSARVVELEKKCKKAGEASQSIETGMKSAGKAVESAKGLSNESWDRLRSSLMGVDNAVKVLGDSTKTGAQKVDGLLGALGQIPGPVGTIATGARVLKDLLPTPFDDAEKKIRAATTALIAYAGYERTVVQAGIASYQAEGYREAAVAIATLQESGVKLDDILQRLPLSERLFVDGLNNAEKAAYALHAAGVALPPALQSIYDRINEGRGYTGQATEGMTLMEQRARTLGTQLKASAADLASWSEAAKVAQSAGSAFLAGALAGADDRRSLLITRMAMQQEAIDRAEAARRAGASRAAAERDAHVEALRSLALAEAESFDRRLQAQRDFEARKAELEWESWSRSAALGEENRQYRETTATAAHQAELDGLVSRLDAAQESISNFASLGGGDSPLAKAASTALKQAHSVAAALAEVRKAGGDESQALIKSVPGTISAVGQMVGGFLSNKADQYVVEGIAEQAAAFASLAIGDFWGLAQHELSSAAYFYAASQAGKGGGSKGASGAGAAGSGSPATRAQGTSLPQQWSHSTPSTVNLTVNVSALHADRRGVAAEVGSILRHLDGTGYKLPASMIPRRS